VEDAVQHQRVDDAYVEYTGPDESLEAFAATRPNIVVCKSMSKVYALSGLRVAYLVGHPLARSVSCACGRRRGR